MQLVDKIWALCEPAVRELGLELVEVEHVRSPGGQIVRLYVDREGGVTVTDCATVSREMGHLLDAEDLVHGRYFLEVSSPGIDRVLRKPEHFERFRGRAVRVRTNAPLGGRRKFSGTISSCSSDTLCIVEGESDRVLEIPLELLEKANLRGEIDFGRGRDRKKSGRKKGQGR